MWQGRQAIVLAGLWMMMATAAQAEPIRYAIDPAHTQIAFEVDRFGFTKILGFFDTVSGEMMLDVDAPETTTVSATIATGSVHTSNDLRNEHVTGEFWLNAAAHPEISFVSTSVDVTSDNQAVMTGELTLLGVTQEVSLDVELRRMGQDPVSQRNAVGFTATGILSRAAFGNTTAAALIGDDVPYRIEVLALETAN